MTAREVMGLAQNTGNARGGETRLPRKSWRNRARFRILLALGSIIALVVLAVLLDAAAYYNKIHTGLTISGQSVGGLTSEEPVNKVTGLVEKAQEGKIVLTSMDQSWDVLPTDVGTKMDVAGAVSAAMAVTRERNFFVDIGRRFKLYFSSVEVPLNGTVDSALMDKVLGGIAGELDVGPVNAGLAIESGKIKVIEGKNGQVVDQGTLREQLRELLLTLRAAELPVPILIKGPAVQAEDNQQALAEAQTMISAPVVLKDGEKTWTLAPERIVGYMDFTSEYRNGVSTLVPYISAEKLAPFFAGIADEVATKPVNATFKSDGEKAWVVPGVPGKALDPEKTVEAVTAASLLLAERTAVVAVTTTDPDLTTEEAEAMGIRDKLSSYTTEWVGTANRQVNVHITAQYASNVMLAPGEEYSFEKTIGPRTAARGYKLAPGIVGPGKLEDVFGGGICQVSTTLFNAVFFAGLEVTQRRNHSIYIDHYPKGRDATVSAGGPDLRFKNDTANYIWIRASSDGITTTFTIYGTDDGRKVSYTTSDFYNVVARTQVTIPNPSLGPGTSVVRLSGQSGKQVKVVRTVKAADASTIHKDTFISTWLMVPRQIEVGTSPTTTTTTVPSSTTSTTGTTPTTSY
ncbi:MAG TPA: VanW family protein [Thermoleophilia bacterium]|nr:VanW family protein [Thermoleophilia bacterium]